MIESIKDVLHKIGYSQLIDNGQYFRTKPLYRDSDNPTSLSIDKTTGDWYDFGTNTGGKLLQFIHLHSTGTSILSVDDLNKVQSFQPVVSHQVEIQEQEIFSKDCLVRLLKDNSYWNNRGISNETLEIFSGGVAIKGKLMNRYVFPIFNERHDLVGFSGRALQNFNPKWKLLGSKSKWSYPLIFNKPEIIKNKYVILVESIGDMLALWEAEIKNVLVLFGIDISSSIVTSLIKLDVNKIVLALNNDKDNNFIGNIASENGKKFLSKFFDESQILISLPTLKDFGDMTVEEINLWKTNLPL